MTPQEENAMWRNRFILMNLIRIAASVGVLAAILLWQTDIFVRGGSVLGFPIAIICLAISFFGPKYAAGRWRTPPEP
jgi:hypothetical protein